jgi:hypothetical protein
VIAHGLDGGGRYRAAADILRGVVPRTSAVAAGDPLQVGEAKPADIKRVARGLRHSYLCIQGPPGSGKTYTGAQLILDLIGRGHRIGVTSNSHKAINNLLHEVELHARSFSPRASTGGETRPHTSPARHSRSRLFVTAAYFVTKAAKGGGDSEPGGTSGDVIGVVILLLLLFLVVHVYRGRKEAEPPKWMGRLQTATPGFSLKLGALLLGVFPTDIITSSPSAPTWRGRASRGRTAFPSSASRCCSWGRRPSSSCCSASGHRSSSRRCVTG